MLYSGNALYLEFLYEQYLEDPQQIDPRWQQYFSALPKVNGNLSEQSLSATREYFQHYEPTLSSGAVCSQPLANARTQDQKQVRVLQLINAYRFLGHKKAQINPLEDGSTVDVPELTLDHHELSESDLNTVFNTGSLVAPDKLPLAAIIAQIHQTYCGSVGVEYMHIPSTDEKRWIQQKLESVRSTPEYSKSQQRYLLDRLTAAEVLERYLHTKYVGQKRFSLEGAESLIPMLDELIQSAGSKGISEIVLGMAHRGRLNVLVNILGKSPALLFQEFEGGVMNNEGRTGDVKYHMGFSSNMNTPGGPVHLAMAFNPSHLEIVGPVVEGAVRARQDHWEDNPGNQVLPVVMHGDAAFAGQGVVMETLNMSNTRGFKTRGTVHIIINNQIGFTTSFKRDARSTSYCTDVVKMVEAPIFHVNGDDPEAVVFITQLALEYRMKFAKDAVIDLVCYRRQGHNEADEPAVTQPDMYTKIRNLPTTREKYARQLIESHSITKSKADEMKSMSKQRLEKGDPVVPHALDDGAQKPYPVDWLKFAGKTWEAPAKTSISQQQFKQLGEKLNESPDDFPLHPRVIKLMETRRQMTAGKQPLDWGFAELMAYASLVSEGHSVRLSGQDSGRGTFAHRHAVLHEQVNDKCYVPLKHIAPDQGRFVIVDSLLSEEAVLAFEYGYATTEPNTLVIWEAQFGDFANGAQVVIDQFISSGEQKWGRLSGLTMFLPHGFEGQGPEHSSARPERYLQLCAQHNIQVCIPSTPAQVFHMLRRQMIRPYRKPLIVMTPKSLLRHPLAVSNKESLFDGEFQPVIDEIDLIKPIEITRLILCTGKVYYDLLERRRSERLNHIAIIRVEQLYPFPEKQLCKIINQYKNIEKHIWCQEEPLNQGAWYSQQHHLKQTLSKDSIIEAVTRPASASPAVGNLRIHREQQQTIIETSLGLQ